MEKKDVIMSKKGRELINALPRKWPSWASFKRNWKPGRCSSSTLQMSYATEKPFLPASFRTRRSISAMTMSWSTGFWSISCGTILPFTMLRNALEYRL